MFKNYFKIALRNIFRNKTFSFINVFGLAGGIAVCLFIIALIIDQNNYDKFHSKEDRIFRILSQDENAPVPYATAPPLVSTPLKENFGDIEEVVNIHKGSDLDCRYGEKILPFKPLFSESTFFKIFDFELDKGNPATALTEPYSVILKEDAAIKLGIDKEKDIGSTIQINDWGDFKLTGIVKNVPHKSHLNFDILVSHSSMKALRTAEVAFLDEPTWDSTWDSYVYFLLKETGSIDRLQPALTAFSTSTYKGAERKIEFQTQALSGISPTKLVNNPMHFTLPFVVITFLGIVALLVLLTSCFNYANLTIAQSLNRAKEIGVRKVMGAQRWHISFQFIAESVIMSLISMTIAIAILEIVILPQFATLSVSSLFDFDLEISISTYLLFIVFTLVTGLLAGVIPALYLSAFQPVKILKSVTTLKVFSKLGARKFLIVSQFVIAMVFFVTITLIYQQAQHLMHDDYGFNQENIINLELRGQELGKVKTQLIQHKDILSISGTSITHGLNSMQTTSVRLVDSSEILSPSILKIDENFIDNFELKVLAGRPFTNEDPAGKSQMIINERLANQLGWDNPEQAIGQTLIRGEEDPTPVSIIGVINNFAHFSILEKNKTLFLSYEPEKTNVANLKVRSDNISETLAFIENKWSEIDPIHPADYHFFDNQLNEVIGIFNDATKLLGFLTFITLLITILGLLGIASYLVQTRRKEIGIRKVLGANLPRVLWTLSKSLLVLISIAIFIGSPIAYYLNKAWLSMFANTISVSVLGVGASVFFLFLIAMLIILSQAYRIAIANPVNALKQE